MSAPRLMSGLSRAISHETTLPLRNSNLHIDFDGRRKRYFKSQLDGSLIDIRQCTCTPEYRTLEFEGSLSCPVDDHVIWWLRWHWDFADDGKVYDTPPIWPSDRIPLGRRMRIRA